MSKQKKKTTAKVSEKKSHKGRIVVIIVVLAALIICGVLWKNDQDAKAREAEQQAAATAAQSATQESSASTDATPSSSTNTSSEKSSTPTEQSSSSSDSSQVNATSYSFEIPSYWQGKVTVKKSGDTVKVVSKSYPSITLVTLDVEQTDAIEGGDIGSSAIKGPSVSSGKSVAVNFQRWAYVMTYDKKQEDEARSYTDTEANYIIDLVTGGENTFSQMEKGWKTVGKGNKIYFTEDTYLENNLVPTIEAK